MAAFVQVKLKQALRMTNVSMHPLPLTRYIAPLLRGVKGAVCSRQTTEVPMTGRLRAPLASHLHTGTGNGTML